MRLDVRLLDFGHFIFRFEDLIGFGKSFFHIADVDADLSGQILLGIGIRKVDKLRLIVNARSALAPSTARESKNGRQDFVFDIDQRQRLFRDLGVSAATNATRSPTKRTLLSSENVSSGPGIGSDCPAVE